MAAGRVGTGSFKGTVAFRRSGAYGIEAVIWLHESAYGLSAGSHALDPSGSLNPSALYDLNDDGIAVGQVDGIEFGTGNGIIWDVPGDEIIMLGNLDDDPPESVDPWSRATAINDDDPPIVVGDSGTAGRCHGYDESASRAVSRGVWAELAEEPDLAELPPYNSDESTFANDVSLIGASGWQVAGTSDRWVSIGICQDLFEVCNPRRDAVTWLSGNPNLAEKLHDNGTLDGSAARGVNDDGAMVGFWEDSEAGCFMYPIYWEDYEDEEPDVLPVPDDNEGRAEALNNLEPPQIVGWDEEQSEALLWESDGEDGWDVFVLEDLVPGPSPDLHYAHDINDDGWIVAIGDAEPGGGTDYHAYLLTPIDCYGDLNDDGIIGFDELLIILSTWGDYAGISFADLDYDGEVGFEDLLIVLSNWGLCPGESGSEPDDFITWLEENTCLDEDDWDLYNDIMTDPESTEQEKGNATCWFEHYTHCTSSCGYSPCNGTDPFNNACGGH